MKRVVRVNGKPYEVELDRGNRRLKIGGETLPYDKEGNTLFLKGKPVSYDLLAGADGLPRGVVLRGKWISIEIHAGGEELHHAPPVGTVHAPLNGQVVKVAVGAGEKVNARQVILILEAMKMENEMAAPFRGVLKAIHVREKQVVKAGELLFQIEPLPDP